MVKSPTDHMSSRCLHIWDVALQCEGRKEGNVLLNDALNTFYLWLFDTGHMVKDYSDSETENPHHGLLLPISSKRSFICTIPQS